MQWIISKDIVVCHPTVGYGVDGRFNIQKKMY